MSTYYDIYCRTCSVKGDVFHVNHGGKAIAHLCHDLAHLTAMGKAYAQLSYEADLGGGSNSDNMVHLSPRLLEFAVEHAGHDVAARDEYGGFFDRCAKRWQCGSCDSVHCCNKPPDHTGRCGPTATLARVDGVTT